MQILAIIILLIAILVYVSIRNKRLQQHYLNILNQVYTKFGQELKNVSLQHFRLTIESDSIYQKYKNFSPQSRYINQTIVDFKKEYNKAINDYIKKHKIVITKNTNTSPTIKIKLYKYHLKEDIIDLVKVFSFTFFFTYPVWLGIFTEETTLQHDYTCTNWKKYCYEMTSCSEAYFYMNECGVDRLDRDLDGTPCEGTLCF